MKNLSILFLLLLCSAKGISQGEEWVTYSDEIRQYEISYPDGWDFEASDEQAATSLVFGNAPDNINGFLVFSSLAYGTLNKNFKTYKSIVKRNAKKNNDTYFQVLNEGSMVIAGQKCLWVEYLKTQKLDDGTVNKLTIKEYYLVHKRQKSLFGDEFRIQFLSTSEDYNENKAIQDKIIQSFQFIAP